ncbi:MAG TPA: DUF4013 domain-containing protein [Anaerolineales bacterium]|nr:DUF4013 domain-containing protein [Anaerolineales bacterium]
MDIEKSFTFPFEDKEWTAKLGLGAAIGLVPILNFAWSGYMVGIIRNVMSNTPEPLPTWDDLGRKFTDGLIIVAASLIYALPMLILLCLPLSAMAFSGILSGNSDMEELARTLAGAGSVLFICLLCVFGLYGLLLSIIHPAILVMFAREGTFASCFKLREAFDLISRNARSFFTAWGLSLLVNLGVGLAIGFVNAIVSFIPCLGTLVGLALSLLAGAYIITVYAHLFGQFGREAFGQNQLVPVG